VAKPKPLARVKTLARAKLLARAKPLARVKTLARARLLRLKPLARAKLLAKAKPLARVKTLARAKLLRLNPLARSRVNSLSAIPMAEPDFRKDGRFIVRLFSFQQDKLRVLQKKFLQRRPMESKFQGFRAIKGSKAWNPSFEAKSLAPV
jgi:hypothetical protein